MSLSQIAFEALIIGPQPTAKNHAVAHKPFLDAARQAASVHQSAAEMSSAPGYLREIRHEAIMLLTCHSFNLFIDLLGSVFDGRFDTAAYLARPFLDSSALLIGAGRDNHVANRMLSGVEVKASVFRKDAVARRREWDPETADEVDRIFREDAVAANTLSHINATQLSKLIGLPRLGSRVATLGGRVDLEEALAMLRVAGYCELQALLALREVGEFGNRWDDRCERALKAIMAWSQSEGTA